MQTNTELLKVFKEHKHNLDLLVGPSEGLLAALPSLNIIDSKLIVCAVIAQTHLGQNTTPQFTLKDLTHRLKC